MMSRGQADKEARGNRLLGAMAAASRVRIEPHLEPIVLNLGDVVCEAGGLLKHAYFPQGNVLSLLTVLEDGSAVETANIGREGAFGLFAAMYSRVSFNRCLVQFEGSMVRCPIELLQSEFKQSEHVRNLFVSYSETLLSQVQQTVACNALHSTEERICRWLLMMHDRAQGEALPYTHEFLSHMLGANRKSVTLAAQSLQAAGLISYRRGKIRVVDRTGLEHASRKCYAVVRERFLTPPSTARCRAIQADDARNNNVRESCAEAAVRSSSMSGFWPIDQARTCLGHLQQIRLQSVARNVTGQLSEI
jgi:CRP-like cAMP-binding protein